MVLSIKDRRTDELARELASATEESLTVAIRTAVEERLARVKAAQKRVGSEGDLARFIERGRARAALDSRSAEEILGYDDSGVPA